MCERDFTSLPREEPPDDPSEEKEKTVSQKENNTQREKGRNGKKKERKQRKERERFLTARQTKKQGQGRILSESNRTTAPSLWKL